MLSLIKRNLSIKLLLMLILVLGVSFAGLSFTILKRQSGLLLDMSERIAAALKETEKSNKSDFSRLESEVNQLLGQMKDDTSANLSNATRDALIEEEKQVQKGLESLLLKSAQGVTGMLNSVTPSTIMQKNFRELIKYSKAAAQTDEIVYTLFFDKEGEPLPGFLNAKDKRVKQYVKTGQGDTNIQKVVSQSKKDPEVIVFEQPIEYFGAVQGKIIICMSRDSVIQEVAELNSRFANLTASNEARIATALETGSKGVTSEIKKNLNKITLKNTAAFQNTADILLSSAGTVKSSITYVTITVGLFCSLLILTLTGLVLKFAVITPIQKISDGLKDTAQGEGDLTRRLGSHRTDEIGTLANWFDAFLERLNTIIIDIRTNAGTVTRASQEVLSAASGMNKDSEELSDRANAVAAATEEMSTNMDSVAAASEQAATNMSTVSDAAGQMKMTLSEVAQNCDKARSVTDQAGTNAATASTRVEQLGDAAREISKVTEVITEIAEQTNLLALNATIEAARAGESGKGFAVVAGEIKSLASQTADATLNIREKIQGIQISTQDTVTEVGNITRVISEVNEIVVTIAGAVEEQSAIAAEVAENVSQASDGIDEVNENVAQSSQVSTEIARDISEVNTVTRTISERSSKMEAQAGELSDLSQTLREMIGVFKVSDK